MGGSVLFGGPLYWNDDTTGGNYRDPKIWQTLTSILQFKKDYLPRFEGRALHLSL